MEVEFTAVSSIDEKLQTRYSHWKKNTKLLYDYLNTNTAKWPSLSCQFFPDLDTSTDSHRILLSSFTSSQLPEDENIYIAELSTSKHLNWSSLNNFDMDEMEFKPDTSTKFPSKSLTTTINIKFPNGDCNRARYMPQNPDIIAAASSNGSVYIFDRTKHGSRRMRATQATPSSQNSGSNLYEARYINEEIDIEASKDIINNEALSLSWNLQREGLLATSYSNGSIKIWDLKKYNHKALNISEPEYQFINFDTEGCNDVTWMPLHDSIFAACGETTSSLSLFDIRSNGETGRIRAGFHNSGLNTCKFNLGNNLLLASADSDGHVNIWDIRKLSSDPVLSFEHGSSVSTLEWNPNVHNIVATAGQDDGLVRLWDVSIQNEDKTVFVHAGHMLGVNDISWNLHDPWLLCSVSNDNSIHIWKPASNIIQSA